MLLSSSLKFNSNTSQFQLVSAKTDFNSQTTAENHPSGFLTISGHVALQSLLNPLIRLLRTEDEDTTSHRAYAPVLAPLAVDFSLSSLRTDIYFDGSYYYGLIIHRQLLDVCFADKILLQQFPLSHGKVNILKLLPNAGGKCYKASISFLFMKEAHDVKEDVAICPMEAQAFLMSR